MLPQTRGIVIRAPGGLPLDPAAKARHPVPSGDTTCSQAGGREGASAPVRENFVEAHATTTDKARAEALHEAALEALSRKELDAAREGFEKALLAFEACEDAVGQAMTRHNLGLTCQEAGDLDAARTWFEQSLAISEQEGLDGGIGVTCHQLGMVAQLGKDYAKAKDWYERALAVEEKLENAPAEAKTCHQLGLCAHYAGDLEAARKWYDRSVTIFEGLGDKGNADKTKKLLDYLTDYERQGGDVEHPDCLHHKH